MSAGGCHQSRTGYEPRSATTAQAFGIEQAVEHGLNAAERPGREGCTLRVFLPRTQRSRVLATAALLGGLGGFSIWSAPTAGAQEVRGLVIGINDYVELKSLGGAVNDARDVANALSGAGIGDLVVLENGAATRERITAEWRSLVARSGPGDTLVLTYAGHGGQEQVRIPGTEEDGLDEVLLLGGFRENGPGTRERIVDDELNQWFVEAGERDLRVIFVADSCHSGTLTRSVDPRAPSTASRNARYTVSDDMLALDIAEETAALDHADLPHLSFLAAGQENQEVLEIVLADEEGDPEPRGALSFHFARALEGDADFDRDGMLRRDELWRFIRENVRMRSHSRQTPNLVPVSDAAILLPLSPPSRPAPDAGQAEADGHADEPDAPVPPQTPADPPIADATESAGSAAESEPLSTLEENWQLIVANAGSVAYSALSGADAPSPEAAVRLAVLNGDPASLSRLEDGLDDVLLVSRDDSPDLVWDARAHQVVTAMGDVAAYDVDLAALPATVDKWRAVRVIQGLSALASLRLRVTPNDEAHRSGTRITVEVGGLRHARLVLLGLSGNGIVHYLSRPSDSAHIAPGRPFRLTLEVGEPFGADHIVAVSAGSSLDRLHVELQRLDEKPAARRVGELLAAASAEATGWWSGIQGLFSVP